MRPVQFAIFVIGSVFFSILFASVSKIISTDAGFFPVPEIITHHGGHFETIDDSPTKLMWFVQISDIHISKFRDAERVSDLRQFCVETIKAIKPSIVLASGDLTDAKSAYVVSSSQYEEEWRLYNEVLRSTGILGGEKTLKWIDIRGNHDNFNIPRLYSERDLFMRYSVQRKPRSYFEQVEVGGVKYSFIAVDACLDPGPKRQFNFMGVLSEKDTADLHRIAKETRDLGGNYTVWFGHFPTSCIMAPSAGSRGVRELIGQYPEGYVYLSGHFHTLGNIVPRMYTLHHEGFLELELGDWMRNRLFRVAAFDHGLFSFVDVRHNSWPVILITNPKNAVFNAPSRENPALQRTSTHIRVLAFSTSEIVEAKVKVDSEDWRPMLRKTDNLFVAPWDPELYSKGIHVIKVLVRDARGSREVEQQFALDGTRLPFDFMARLVLMGDLHVVAQCVFYVAIALCTVPLIGFRLRHAFGESSSGPKFSFLRSWCTKMWVLSTVDRLFYPIVGYCLYLTCGPWAFGEVIDGHFSVVFVWGIYVNGTFLPGTLNYLHGFLQLMVCQLPLINIYANRTVKQFYNRPETSPASFLVKLKRHIAFILIMAVEFFLSGIFCYEYGAVAWLVAPMRTWAVILNLYLYFQAIKLPPHCLSSAKSVWPAPERKREDASN